MENAREIPAFREKLKPSRHAEKNLSPRKLLEFEKDDRFVVRLIGYKDALELADKAKVLFDELRSYGINIPVNFVVAQDEDSVPCLWAIADRITPDNTAANSVREREFSALLHCILKYFQDKLGTDRVFLQDVVRDESQYVFGTRPGEAHPRWYLVDVDLDTLSGDENLLDRINHVERWLARLERTSS